MAEKDKTDAVGNVFKLIKEHDIQFVDFRFTDPRGKWQHTAYSAKKVDKASFEDGIMFDGSSIAGWKSINESDMILKPDASTAFLDPFSALPTMIIFCDVVEPSTGAVLHARSALNRQARRAVPCLYRYRRYRLFRPGA